MRGCMGGGWKGLLVTPAQAGSRATNSCACDTGCRLIAGMTEKRRRGALFLRRSATARCPSRYSFALGRAAPALAHPTTQIVEPCGRPGTRASLFILHTAQPPENCGAWWLGGGVACSLQQAEVAQGFLRCSAAHQPTPPPNHPKIVKYGGWAGEWSVHSSRPRLRRRSGSLSQCSRTFTNRNRCTLRPSRAESSSRAALPMALMVCPPLPMTIFFWLSRCT